MRLNRNLIAAIIGMLVSTSSLGAQSTNPSAPTPLSGEYTGKGPSKETNYYFNITAGPGEVSVGLEIKAKDYSTFARIEIGNDPSNLIAMHNMNASTTTGVSSVLKSFKLSEQQTVRVKLTLDGNLSEYKLTVSGGGVSSENPGVTNAGTGSAGKFATPSGSKIGSLIGAQAGKQKNKMTVMCPDEITYQIVPTGDWNATLYGIKKFKFENAVADGGKLFCTYFVNSGGNKDSATLTKNAPPGYTCEVFKSGGKDKIFTCTPVVTASLIRDPEFLAVNPANGRR